MKKSLVAAFAILIVACNTNYEKTPSGLAYKLYHGKGTVKPKAGQFVKFNMAYTLMDRDSVLSSTYGSKVPAFSPVDTGARIKYSIMEILPLMSEGDSAEVSISIDTLKSRGIIPDYNPILVKGQVIKTRLQLLKVYNSEKDMLADYQKSMDDEKVNEQKSLEAYASKNNLKTIKTKNGAYVVVENAGSDPKADSGKIATVMYRGYLETNGKVFDTNMDSSKHHTEPIQIPVGTRGSIQGFSECLPYFGKGGKGKFLIPAMLGYGPQAQGADIPAYSNLIFDIDVVDVTDAPKAPQAPMERPNMPVPENK